MNDNTGQQQSSLLDTVKLLGSVLVLLAGIVSYYYLIQISILFRVLIILASVVVALVIFFQTLRGKTLWEFFQGSRYLANETGNIADYPNGLCLCFDNGHIFLGA